MDPKHSLIKGVNSVYFQINGMPVERITRRGAEAVNFVTEEIPADTEVEMKVDWSRRFDNMQQHSGMEYTCHLANHNSNLLC